MGCEGISAQVLRLCQAERALKTKLLQFLCAKALQSKYKSRARVYKDFILGPVQISLFGQEAGVA